eukprot:gene14310-16922_t
MLKPAWWTFVTLLGLRAPLNTAAPLAQRNIPSPVSLEFDSGGRGRAQLSIPVVGEGALADPATLYSTVKVVETNHHGLVPPKEENGIQPAFTPQEAAHLYVRTQAGVVDSARMLVVFGAVPTFATADSDLHLAAARGDVAAVRAHLGTSSETGVALQAVDSSGADGSTPLMIAAAAGHVEAVRALLREGADPEARALHGGCALHLAAALGHADVVGGRPPADRAAVLE